MLPGGKRCRLALLRPQLGPGSPLSGSSFLGPGTFPDSFPSTTPSTPTLPEFTTGPPPISYQSDIPSSLLTPEKSTPSLPGQVSARLRDPGAVSREPWLFYQILLSFLRWHLQVTWTQLTTLGHLDCTPPTLEAPQAPSCTTLTLPLRPGSPWAQ